MLLDRRQSVALGRDRDAVLGMHMQHALRVLARGMDRRVDGEAGRIRRIAVVEDDTAFEVDLDQARRRDLVENDETLWKRQSRDYQEIFIGKAAQGHYLRSAISVRPPSYSDRTQTPWSATMSPERHDENADANIVSRQIRGRRLAGQAPGD